jgi:hypothetical protein
MDPNPGPDVNGKYKMAYKNEHLKKFVMMFGGLEA